MAVDIERNCQLQGNIDNRIEDSRCPISAPGMKKLPSISVQFVLGMDTTLRRTGVHPLFQFEILKRSKLIGARQNPRSPVSLCWLEATF
jgi:hypothetical protein